MLASECLQICLSPRNIFSASFVVNYKTYQLFDALVIVMTWHLSLLST